MRTVILAMLAALVLVTVASAGYPVEVNVTSYDHVWMVADNRESATITAIVTYGTGEFAGSPIPGANVSFSVNPPYHLTKEFLLTDQDGVARTTLQSTKDSGTANITVTAWTMIDQGPVFGYQNFSASQVFSQRIDHTTPSSILTYYTGQVQIRTPAPIVVYVRDRSGNPVDNRNVVEMVRFDASSTGASGFQSGASWVKSITVPVNESGYAAVQYMADPPGTNYVAITPPSPIWMKLISITGLAQGNPFSGTVTVTPDGTPYPYTQVKTGKFTVGFAFYDQYGYPVSNQPINITTSVPGESMFLTTNKYGMVIITYGPKDIAGIYTLTGTSVTNTSVSVSQKVEFVSGAAADALLTASPQTMASRDVEESISSTLTMKVIDEKGNPVASEPVNFRFTSLTIGAGFNQTVQPALGNRDGTNTSAKYVDIPATSDENGDATATFYPGGFTTDYTVANYNSSAWGTAIVEAQWATVKRQVTLKYLNYRYLTVETEVEPTSIRVNQSVNVTIKVKGDGWALQPKPIDVLLLNDRSGSMLSDMPDRAVSVMAAGNVFSRQLEYSRDRLGVVSFGGSGRQWANSSSTSGWDNTSKDDLTYAMTNYKGNGKSYSDYATLDLGLTNINTTISTAINSTVPGGWTPMRLAIYRAITDTKTRWNPNSVRALILLSDGDYNHYGDPFARGTSTTSTSSADYDDLVTKYYRFSDLGGSGQWSLQNMSIYAKSYNVKIYSIGFAKSLTTGGRDTLKGLAEQTGGSYYDADATNIADVYTAIAGSLKDTAGVNTTLLLSFKNVNVTTNDVTTLTPGDQVYNYTHIDGQSTRIDYGNSSGSYPTYPRSFDNTTEWQTSQKFDFTIGTVRLGEYWKSTVTLQVLKEGTISVFDSSSNVTTQDGAVKQNLKIPDAYIVALPNLSAAALTGMATLTIDELDLTNEGSVTSADLQWNLSYDGMYDISEDLMISEYGYTRWDHMPPLQVSNATPIYDTGSIPITSLAYGYYTIRLEVEAYDSNPAARELTIYISEAGVRELHPGEVPVPGAGAVPTQKARIKIS